MKSKLKIYGIYMIVYLLLLPTLVTLGAVACMNHLGDDGYFTTTTLSDIANIGVAATVIFLLTYVFWANKKTKLIPSFTSPLNYGPCAVMAAALIFISAHLTISAVANRNSIDIFTLVAGILALLSVIYFAVAAVSVKRRSIKRSDFGLIVLVFLCIYIAYIFFDRGTPINAPIKTATMMAFLAFAMFFLYETRLSLGRERWNCYVAFAFISSITCAYASIPALVVYIIKNVEIGISIYETILVFAFFIFSTFKLFLVGELVPEKGSNVVDKLIESAKNRANELQPDEPNTSVSGEEEDENQLSILDVEETAEESSEDGVNTSTLDVSEGNDTAEAEGAKENEEPSDAEAEEVAESTTDTVAEGEISADEDGSVNDESANVEDSSATDENTEKTEENTDKSEPV